MLFLRESVVNASEERAGLLVIYALQLCMYEDRQYTSAHAKTEKKIQERIENIYMQLLC